ARGEVVIETEEEQLFDLRVAILSRRDLARGCAVGTERIGHKRVSRPRRIIAAWLAEVQRRAIESAARMVIECIPNVSEGRRAEVIASIADAVRAVAGVRLLDFSSDASHNRSVFTFAGDRDGVRQAV